MPNEFRLVPNAFSFDGEGVSSECVSFLDSSECVSF